MRAILPLCLMIVATGSTAAAAARSTASLSGTAITEHAGTWYTVPQAVNNRGEIAGFAVQSDEVWVAFIRSSRGRYDSIADCGFVNDMNDKGEIVGVVFAAADTGSREASSGTVATGCGVSEALFRSRSTRGATSLECASRRPVFLWRA